MKPPPAVPVSVPAISVTYAAPPLLVSAEANPEHVGCTAKKLTDVLRDMAKSPQYRRHIVRLPGRQCFAAAPDEVLRYLRERPLPAANDAGQAEPEEAEAREKWGG